MTNRVAVDYALRLLQRCSISRADMVALTKVPVAGCDRGDRHVGLELLGVHDATVKHGLSVLV
jgi:hypothetical protein